jgi:hypothetical protein
MEQFHCERFEAKVSAAACAGRYRLVTSKTPTVPPHRCQGCPVGLCHVQRQRAPGIGYTITPGGMDLGLSPNLAGPSPIVGHVHRAGRELDELLAQQAERVSRAEVKPEPEQEPSMPRAKSARPTVIQCETCPTQVPVGAKGVVPRYCRACRHNADRRAGNGEDSRVTIERVELVAPKAARAEPEATPMRELAQKALEFVGLQAVRGMETSEGLMLLVRRAPVD